MSSLLGFSGSSNNVNTVNTVSLEKCIEDDLCLYRLSNLIPCGSTRNSVAIFQTSETWYVNGFVVPRSCTKNSNDTDTLYIRRIDSYEDWLSKTLYR